MSSPNPTSPTTPPASGGSRSGFSRRSFVAGAAWSAPVVAIAAAVPFASASGSCTEQAQVDWATTFVAAADKRSGQGESVTPTGAVVTYTVAVTTGPNIEIPATSDNLNSTSSGVFLGDRQTVASADKEFDAAYMQRATVTFDRPVTKVSFRIFDVDGSTFYREHLRVVSVPEAVGIPGGGENTRVEFDPLSNTFRPIDDEAIGQVLAGSVGYEITGPTTSFTVELTTPRTAVPPQGVLSHGVRMTNIAYTTACALA
ncbi:hypothetical protein C5B85_13820 [Pseudoclavibacter sp. AY1F1]|uniref:hypothetical protein n=1 Tax=Pseudoclavibacter sp. AY1F1 TaxID=2080583 RepID=UPI000CE78AF2|nr:hypothetical protein [Pseudoclavibacter sp. AY1F1]PPF43391.1 hypothetical protein C5B85_13820 [Pseudoclavibacter sp. AY1F1]